MQNKNLTQEQVLYNVSYQFSLRALAISFIELQQKFLMDDSIETCDKVLNFTQQ